MDWDRLSKQEMSYDKNRRTQIQNLKNKKIYFDADGTEIKIGYEEQTGAGFVEIIDNQ